MVNLLYTRIIFGFDEGVIVKNLKYILGFMAFLVASYFAYDVLKNKENPCGQLFEQTTASLTTKISLFEKDTPLTIGRNQIQALSSSAQQMALSLQSCCIAAHTSVISGEQFLQCQTGVNTYASRLDAISARLAELESKSGEPIEVASNEAVNPDYVSVMKSNTLKPSAIQPRMAPVSVAVEEPQATKPNKKSDIDKLIEKALSASMNYQKNVKKAVK